MGATIDFEVLQIHGRFGPLLPATRAHVLLTVDSKLWVHAPNLMQEGLILQFD